MASSNYTVVMYRCKFSDFDNYIKDMYKNVLIYRKYTKQYSKMIRHYISDLLSKELGKGSLHYACNFSVHFRLKTIQSVCVCVCVCVYDNPRQCIIKKQRHHFADECLSKLWFLQ